MWKKQRVPVNHTYCIWRKYNNNNNNNNNTTMTKFIVAFYSSMKNHLQAKTDNKHKKKNKEERWHEISNENKSM